MVTRNSVTLPAVVSSNKPNAARVLDDSTLYNDAKTHHHTVNDDSGTVPVSSCARSLDRTRRYSRTTRDVYPVDFTNRVCDTCTSVETAVTPCIPPPIAMHTMPVKDRHDAANTVAIRAKDVLRTSSGHRCTHGTVETMRTGAMIPHSEDSCCIERKEGRGGGAVNHYSSPTTPCRQGDDGTDSSHLETSTTLSGSSSLPSSSLSSTQVIPFTEQSLLSSSHHKPQPPPRYAKSHPCHGADASGASTHLASSMSQSSNNSISSSRRMVAAKPTDNKAWAETQGAAAIEESSVMYSMLVHSSAAWHRIARTQAQTHELPPGDIALCTNDERVCNAATTTEAAAVLRHCESHPNSHTSRAFIELADKDKTENSDADKADNNTHRAHDVGNGSVDAHGHDTNTVPQRSTRLRLRLPAVITAAEEQCEAAVKDVRTTDAARHTEDSCCAPDGSVTKGEAMCDTGGVCCASPVDTLTCRHCPMKASRGDAIRYSDTHFVKMLVTSALPASSSAAARRPAESIQEAAVTAARLTLDKEAATATAREEKCHIIAAHDKTHSTFSTNTTIPVCSAVPDISHHSSRDKTASMSHTACASSPASIPDARVQPASLCDNPKEEALHRHMGYEAATKDAVHANRACVLNENRVNVPAKGDDDEASMASANNTDAGPVCANHMNGSRVAHTTQPTSVRRMDHMPCAAPSSSSSSFSSCLSNASPSAEVVKSETGAAAVSVASSLPALPTHTCHSTHTISMDNNIITSSSSSCHSSKTTSITTCADDNNNSATSYKIAASTSNKDNSSFSNSNEAVHAGDDTAIKSNKIAAYASSNMTSPPRNADKDVDTDTSAAPVVAPAHHHSHHRSPNRHDHPTSPTRLNENHACSDRRSSNDYHLLPCNFTPPPAAALVTRKPSARAHGRQRSSSSSFYRSENSTSWGSRGLDRQGSPMTMFHTGSTSGRRSSTVFFLDDAMTDFHGAVDALKPHANTLTHMTMTRNHTTAHPSGSTAAAEESADEEAEGKGRGKEAAMRTHMAAPMKGVHHTHSRGEAQTMSLPHLAVSHHRFTLPVTAACPAPTLTASSSLSAREMTTGATCSAAFMAEAALGKAKTEESCGVCPRAGDTLHTAAGVCTTTTTTTPHGSTETPVRTSSILVRNRVNRSLSNVSMSFANFASHVSMNSGDDLEEGADAMTDRVVAMVSRMNRRPELQLDEGYDIQAEGMHNVCGMDDYWGR